MESLAALLAGLQSGEPVRAEAAATALPAWGAQGLAALAPLLQDPDDETRWWAVRSLAGFSLPAAGQLLTAALADASPAVQQCAALALSQQLHPPAIPALVGLLAGADSLLARLAADALVAQGAPAVLPLVAVLQAQPVGDAAGQQAASVQAARALALIGDTRAIPALFALLESDSVMLEHWASEGLQRMGVGLTFFKP